MASNACVIEVNEAVDHGHLIVHAIRTMGIVSRQTLAFYVGSFLANQTIYFVCTMALANMVVDITYARVFVLTYIIAMPTYALARYALTCLETELKGKLMLREYARYQRLSYVSKSSLSAKRFATLYGKYEGAITIANRCGVASISGTFMSVVSCIAVASKYTSYFGIVVTLIVFATICILVMPRLVKAHKTIVDRTNEEDNHTKNLWTNYAGKFQQSKIETQEIVDIVMKPVYMWKEVKKYVVMNFMCPIVITNMVVILAYCVFPSEGFTKIAPVIFSMDFHLCDLMFFYSDYTEKQTEYDTYMQAWDGTIENTNDIKKDLPDDLVILECHVEHVNMHHTVPITIRHGDIILIKGKSGGGKTSFVNALVGKTEGVVLGGMYKPQELTHNYVEFYQAIKEDMPLDNVTYSEFFRTRNTKEITAALSICGYTKFAGSIDDVVFTKLSGGEKDRLALAAIIHDAEVAMRDGKHHILILDEPGKELDDVSSLDVVEGILDFCLGNNLTTIVISHHSNFFNLDCWTQRYDISNGTITRF